MDIVSRFSKKQLCAWGQMLLAQKDATIMTASKVVVGLAWLWRINLGQWGNLVGATESDMIGGTSVTLHSKLLCTIPLMLVPNVFIET